MKTIDAEHMTISLSVDIGLMRNVDAGSRSEAVAKMIDDLKPELAYIKQRLQHLGFSPLVRVNSRITI